MEDLSKTGIGALIAIIFSHTISRQMLFWLWSVILSSNFVGFVNVEYPPQVVCTLWTRRDQTIHWRLFGKIRAQSCTYKDDNSNYNIHDATRYAPLYPSPTGRLGGSTPLQLARCARKLSATFCVSLTIGRLFWRYLQSLLLLKNTKKKKKIRQL